MRLWPMLRQRWPWADSAHVTPARLVDLPGQSREPSALLLARLRALDPRAEVVYVGQGRWWVGRVKPDSPRRLLGRRMLLRLQASDGFVNADWWPQYRQALLMAQGFGLVVDETVVGEPDGLLVAEFERALWVERGGRLKTTADAVAEELRHDRLRASRDRERELYRWLFRRSPRGQGNPWVGGVTNQPTGRLL